MKISFSNFGKKAYAMYLNLNYDKEFFVKKPTSKTAEGWIRQRRTAYLLIPFILFGNYFLPGYTDFGGGLRYPRKLYPDNVAEYEDVLNAHHAMIECREANISK